MNQADFHRAVRRIANGEYFVTAIEVGEHPDSGKLEFEFKAYISSRSWTYGPTADDVLAKLLDVAPKRSIESLDALPEVAPAPAQSTVAAAEF